MHDFNLFLPIAKIDAAKRMVWGYSVFSGSFNFRPIRGSARLSMHAYGAAIDWDAPDNPMGYGNLHHRFTDADPLIAAFKAEGWRWGGDYCSRHDYMHVEACR